MGRCGKQNMLRPYLKIWEWELILGGTVKAIASPGVRSSCVYVTFIQLLVNELSIEDVGKFFRFFVMCLNIISIPNWNNSRYSCNVGYRLDPPKYAVRSCGVLGHWQGSNPICRREYVILGLIDS